MKFLNRILFLWMGLVRRCAGVPIQLTVNQRGTECLYEQLKEGYVSVRGSRFIFGFIKFSHCPIIILTVNLSRCLYLSWLARN
jgi:hypothetical protein